MKKFYYVCVIIISMFLLISCGDSLKNSEIIRLSTGESVGGQEVSFSLNKGLSWYSSDNRLTEFDIWDVMINKDVPSMVFFYATSYKQLLKEVDKNRSTPFYSYGYPDDEAWNKILDIYNEEYFEDYILLFYYKYEPNISENYVYNVIIKDNTLILNINRFEGDTTAVSSWYEFITIKKKDVENITKYNIAVRTVSKLISSFVLPANEAYMRKIYVDGLSVSDFPGLNNLKSVRVWTSGLKVDIYFNQAISDERLNEIIEVLKSSENIRSVGDTSNTWVRVTVNDKFYDKYNERSLTLEDLVGNQINNSGEFTLRFNKITPFILITFEMEQHGRHYYEAMIEQLKELNFPFVNLESLS